MINLPNFVKLHLYDPMNSLHFSLSVLFSPLFAEDVRDNSLAFLCEFCLDSAANLLDSLEWVFLEKIESWMVLAQLFKFEVEGGYLLLHLLDVVVFETLSIFDHSKLHLVL
jgi:hypothetical protein